ncbi:MAG: prolyl oligopeptidase family serine peptidase [Actinobacteria bacterium]|nr:prolyl oligopeptidase family serine peptidase [Actinomycetota bacterium]
MTQRSLTPHDLSGLEELPGAALSPDGRWLAYVRKRPRRTATFHKYDFLSGGDRCDVWIVDAAGGAPQNLTRGADDGSGHWAPSWSPDANRLALLSTRGGNVCAWVCDIGSRTLHRLSERAVDLASHAAPMLWVSNDEILLATLPEGERPGRMTVEIRAAETAMREWPKAWKGLEPTASALDSGATKPFGERPQGALVLVDAATGRERTVMRGLFRDLRIAPDGRHVAFFRQVDVRRPQADGKLERLDGRVARLGIVTADGKLLAGAVQQIEQPISTSLRWSADSTEVALLGHVDAAAGSSKLIFRYRLVDGRLRHETDASVEPTSIVWTGDNSILAFARPTQGSSPERADWWLVASGAEPRKLSADLDAVPMRLFPEEGRRSFVGLGAEGVLRLSLSDGRWANLTDGFERKISGLLWPPPGESDRRTAARLVLTVDSETSLDRFSLDLRSGAMTSLRWPSDGAWLLHFAPEHDTAVHGAFDRTGAGLWISRPAFEQHRAIVETNMWLRDVAEGQIRRVDYRGATGDELTGWLILPVDHEPGRRYPLITAVYPGFVFRGQTPPTTLSIVGEHANNPQLLAARGYTVLFPSIPLNPEGEPSDPYLDVANGVLPAIDAAVEMGFADADRIGLLGHSYGGYGTYALITQTQRFRAAVALAGIADLVSLYGQFDARLRYEPHAHEYLQQSLAETGQLRMGAAPWQDPERYVRNSPLFAAGDVQTPLLIIQGDMDYVPLQQGEQFFSALYRQGKRARFVRYWGEGHVFQSPANIEDMWQQIFGWFDEFLS